MKLYFKYLVVYWIVAANLVYGQLAINFEPHFGNDLLVAGKKYFLKTSGDTVSVEELRFYVSNIEFLFNDEVVYKASDKYFLIDIREASSQKINFPFKSIVNYDRVRFSLGVDSLTNTSGALGGVLDPTKDMYWSWQSGYVNLKLEGSCKSCPTRNHRYQFHIGGYLSPYKTVQVIDLLLEDAKPVIAVRCEKLLGAIGADRMCEIMSPGDRAVNFANGFQQAFVLQK